MTQFDDEPDDTISPLQYMTAKWSRVQNVPVETVQVHVLGYARFSTLQQKESSIERQQVSIRATAASHRLPDPQMYVDRAVTAVHNERDELQRCLEFSDRQPGSILIVETVDRLIRSKLSYAELTLRFAKSGTRLFDRNGEVHDLMGMLQAMFAAEERNRIIYRLQSGRRQAARKGRWMGTAPFGYVRGGNGRLAPCPETAPLVQELFRRRAAGESLVALAADFTSRQIATSRKRNGWCHSSISRILCNSIYVGVYRSKLMEEN